MKNILKATDQNIAKAAEIIRQGGLVVFPTETVYGLGADALNPDAVLKIFQAKQRPAFDPLIVHIADKQSLYSLCTELPPVTERLISAFWPGPLTVILKKNRIVPDIVTSGLPTVAVRMPDSSIARQLIKAAGTPVAAPSANKFGYISPTQAEFVSEQLGEKVDLILDGGPTELGIESTVVSLIDKPVILRPGGIPVEYIQKIIRDIKISRENSFIESPGQLQSHYSPHTPLEFITPATILPENNNYGLLAFKEPVESRKNFKSVKILSSKGSFPEAAKNLFSSLYELDKMGLDKIYVERIPEEDLGIAIMDRLRKAVGTN